MDTASRRVQRFEHEVRDIVARYLVAGFKTPLPALVTISRVIMPKDLKTAKVYVSVLGTDKAKEQCVEILQSRAFEVQKYIAQTLKARNCPKLTFYIDDATEAIMRVERELFKLEQQRRKEKETEENEEET